MKTLIIGRLRCTVIVLFTLFAILSGCGSSSPLQTEEYDTVITNGRIIDGTGNPWYYADIAIKDNQIAKIGNLGDLPARNVIDAEGLYVTPGFIDVHSHAGSGLTKKALGDAKPHLAVRQAMTQYRRWR